MASFINSDGWRRSWPKPIHRDEPPGRHPDAGHEDDDQQGEVTDEQGIDHLRHVR